MAKFKTGPNLYGLEPAIKKIKVAGAIHATRDGKSKGGTPADVENIQKVWPSSGGLVMGI